MRHRTGTDDTQKEKPQKKKKIRHIRCGKGGGHPSTATLQKKKPCHCGEKKMEKKEKTEGVWKAFRCRGREIPLRKEGGGLPVTLRGASGGTRGGAADESARPGCPGWGEGDPERIGGAGGGGGKGRRSTGGRPRTGKNRSPEGQGEEVGKGVLAVSQGKDEVTAGSVILQQWIKARKNERGYLRGEGKEKVWN